jgi:omega-amidase
MTNYRLSLIQTHIEWEDPEMNYRRYEKLIDEKITETDAVLLPEMFATGFSMNTAEFAESMEGPSVSWMQKMAATRNIAIGGSLIISENEGVKNRFIWMLPDGNFTFYDKRHLFRMGLENEFYRPGEKRVVVEHKGFRFLLAVCYDLRFRFGCETATITTPFCWLPTGLLPAAMCGRS